MLSACEYGVLTSFSMSILSSLRRDLHLRSNFDDDHGAACVVTRRANHGVVGESSGGLRTTDSPVGVMPRAIPFRSRHCGEIGSLRCQPNCNTARFRRTLRRRRLGPAPGSSVLRFSGRASRCFPRGCASAVASAIAVPIPACLVFSLATGSTPGHHK